MTPAHHLKAADFARRDARAQDVAAHLAAERGDTIGAFSHLSERHFHAALAAHHEAQAASLAQAPACLCPGGTCPDCGK